MIRVRLLNTVVDLPDDTARDLIARGLAVPDDGVRAAVVTPPRNAARRTTKPLPREAVN